MSPEYTTWSWNNISYRQYHAGYILLVESLTHPMRPDMERIWQILDFVFEYQPLISRTHKSKSVLEKIMLTITRIHIHAGVYPHSSLDLDAQGKRAREVAFAASSAGMARRDVPGTSSATLQPLDPMLPSQSLDSDWLGNAEIDWVSSAHHLPLRIRK